MKVRKFRTSDSIEVAKLHRNTIRYVNRADYPSRQIKVWSGRTSAKRFRNSVKTRVRFVAVDKGKILGFGDYAPDGELSGLYIHKDFQGKGVGKNLLIKLEKQARKQGIKEFHLSSTITAKDFYKRNGYKIIKKGKHEISGQNLTIYRMKKKL
ncbi:GNAT family N-acetyltransferase [Candidatus Woesearchaeota archaeon]|nr:GNAT family N-acetyltransferase [Candidatus Woesearchaeota archaeon]